MSDISKVGFPKIVVPSVSGKATQPKRALGTGFGEMVQGFVNDVNKSHHQADKAVEDLVTGKTDHVHKTVIAMGKAEMNFRFMMEVRSKMLQAYQEVQRMQV